MSTKTKFMTIAMALAAFHADGSTQYWTYVGSANDPSWYDFNKDILATEDTDSEGKTGYIESYPKEDSNLCWAASSSNMLTWWQCYNKEDEELAEIPNGYAMWEIYRESFEDYGYNQHGGISWWLSGELGMTDDPDDKEQSRPKKNCPEENGNYYGFNQSDIDSYLTMYSVSPHSNYLKSRLVGEMKAGKSIGLSIFDTAGELAHAITLWGVEYDEASGKITKIWITDSDDYILDGDGVCVSEKYGIRNGLKDFDVVEKEITTSEGHNITALVIEDYNEESQGMPIFGESGSSENGTEENGTEENGTEENGTEEGGTEEGGTEEGGTEEGGTEEGGSGGEVIEGEQKPNYVYIGNFVALSKDRHAPIDTSVASLMATVNGKKSFTLIDKLLDPDTPSEKQTNGTQPNESAPPQEPTAPKELEALEQYSHYLTQIYDLATLERVSTAVAGTSIPTLGKAFSDDLNRQLRTMRDRATQTTRSIAPKKNYHVWVEADGTTARLSSQAMGTEGGYDLHSWGGTAGFTAKCSSDIHAGLAFTALYGNFNANANGRSTGDMDTYYFTTFATLNSGNWEHSLIATAGRADTTLTRDVSYGNFHSHNRGKSDGMGFGLMYETAYHIKCQEGAITFSPVLNVSASHSRLAGYTERGDALALAPGLMDMKVLTIGAGARMQAEFGENLFNRKAQFQCRAMVNSYLGDRRAESLMKFAAAPTSHILRSAESGSVGLELGAGVALPLGDGSSTIYADAAAEFNSGYNSANFNLGYRFSF